MVTWENENCSHIVDNIPLKFVNKQHWYFFLALNSSLNKSQQWEVVELFLEAKSRRTNNFLKGKFWPVLWAEEEARAATGCFERWWSLRSWRDSEVDFGQGLMWYYVLTLSGQRDQKVLWETSQHKLFLLLFSSSVVSPETFCL